jgi:hypothetical protein
MSLDLPGSMANAHEAAKFAAAAGDTPLQLGAAAASAVLDLFNGSAEKIGERVLPIGQMAMDLYSPANHADSVEGIIQLCAFAQLICDDAQSAVELLRRLIHQSDAAGLAGRSIFSRLALAEGLWRIGWWADALAEMSQLISLQRAVGQGHLVPLAYALQCRLEASMGHEKECLDHAEQALDAAMRLGLAQLGVFAVTGRACCTWAPVASRSPPRPSTS